MKLLGNTESKITEDKKGENVPHLEIVELVLIHCNIVNNYYQQNSRVVYTFVPNKPFGSLLEISTPNHIFLKTFNSEFQEIKVWFNAIFIECNSHCIKMCYSIEPRKRRYVKGYGFLSFARNLGTHATKVAKNLNNTYGEKLADSAKKSATDALKIASKRAIQKTAEATGDLVGNTIANKITSISKKSTSEPHSNVVSNEIPKERYISPQERQKIIDELRLI